MSQKIQIQAAKVLVICPASLKSQWRSEIDRFSNRDTQIVLGRADERVEQYDIKPADRRVGPSNLFAVTTNNGRQLRNLVGFKGTRMGRVKKPRPNSGNGFEYNTTNTAIVCRAC